MTPGASSLRARREEGAAREMAEPSKAFAARVEDSAGGAAWKGFGTGKSFGNYLTVWADRAAV
jgi:hypothetical protein